MAKTQGPTYKPSKITRIRKFGFMSRNSSKNGRNVIKRRRVKGRYVISASESFGSKVQKNKLFKRRK